VSRLATRFSFGLVLAVASLLKAWAASLPDACKLPPDLEQALHHHPTAKGYEDAGSWFAQKASSNCALAAFQEALRLDTHFVPALVGMGMARANSGDNEAAEKLFRQAVEYDPSYEPAHLNLGLILARRQKFAEAETEADRAANEAPGDPAALAALGRIKARLGKGTESVSLLRRAVALAPQSAAMHLDLGMVLAESYDLSGALAENTEAVRLAPGSALAHLNRGRVLFDLRRPDEARPDLELARRIGPQMPEPWYFLAMIEKDGGNYARAAELFQTVVKLQPRNAAAWNLLGQSLDNNSQTKRAIEAWKQALALEPDNAQALFTLARAIKPTNPDEAARLLARYDEVHRQLNIADQAKMLGNEAVAAAMTHDWPEAIRQFQKAIELCGDCTIKADLHKKFGLTDAQMGDLENAAKELRLAQSLNPADPDIDPALARIKQASATPK